MDSYGKVDSGESETVIVNKNINVIVGPSGSKCSYLGIHLTIDSGESDSDSADKTKVTTSVFNAHQGV